jgi:hypothetical protein
MKSGITGVDASSRVRGMTGVIHKLGHKMGGTQIIDQ